MLNLFGKNAFARKRHAKMMPIDSLSRVETLEDRIVLASQMSSAFSNGNLTLSGSGFADNVVVSITGTNTVTLSSIGDVTAFTGAGAGPFLVTGNLTIDMGNGDDTLVLRVDGAAGAGSLSSGIVSINLGAGRDTLITADLLTFTGNVSITGGTETDVIQLGSDSARVSAYKLTIDGGTDTPAIFDPQQITLDGVTTGSDVSIKNSGTGEQNIITGVLAPNSIGGNLTITQSGANNTGGNYALLNDTSVGGNLLVTNINSITQSTIDIRATQGPVVIGGITTLTNGNSNTNTIRLTGTDASLTFAKNLTLKNGGSTSGYNSIDMTDVIGNGAASTFTNGSGGNNTINFGGTISNVFSGSVAVTNGIASSGGSSINIRHLSTGKGLTVTNGSASGNAPNAISIGTSVATDTVNVGGDFVVTNGSTAISIITIDRLTTTSNGNVTINNGAIKAGGFTIFDIGTYGPNIIAGNLSITNQASAAAGARNLTINQTAVNGRSGIFINNVGAGNTATSIGANPGSINLVTAAGGVKIQDGTGTAAVTINLLQTSNFTYTDLGGGADVINLADSEGNLVISGVTRIDTGNGSDIVNIATNGIAFFGGMVSIALGSGNDELHIGPNAASPAFSTASNFQFDGGAGNDSAFISPLSVADYFPGILPGKLKSKITGFEALELDAIP